jgi:DNA helicase-2/ATP-dependent DNA helicase PcrA
MSRASSDQLLRGLNAEQKLAVTTTDGPVLVLAGAGSGKTRVITVRIAWLLAHGVAPSNVLAMTFTNKAAAEMRERIAALVGREQAAELTVGTFHSFCVRLLRKHAKEAGLAPNFTICDASDQLAALKGALRELRIGETRMQPSVLQARISLAKNRLIASDAYLDGAKDDQDELVGRAWKMYDEHLARARSLDFDDLLLRALRLLRDRTAVRGELEKRFRYVMVDEYQDTNGPQYEIVRAIAKKQKNLCVVGDDDQSIYGWRGADVTKILSFEKDFAPCVVVRLETNYRSTEPILEAANRVIACNPKRHEKTLRSALGPGDPIVIGRLEDETAEADHVAREIQELVRARKARLADFAILFRTQTQPRAFEAQFRARAVPYVLIGGMSFFDRKEVRDVLAYLRLAANPDDEMSFLRVINCPPRGVGKTTIDRALELATERGSSVMKAFESATQADGAMSDARMDAHRAPESDARASATRRLDSDARASDGRARDSEARTNAAPKSAPALSSAAVDAVHSFRAKMASLGREDPGRALVPWIRELLEAVDYRSEVDRVYPDAKTREDRWSGVMEILNFAENHVARDRKPGLASFLEALTLTAADELSAEDAHGRDAVTLMTLHSAKGLEFPRVYLVGVEEGILPHARSVAEDTVEEERRLMYVGITRAQKHLTITCTKTRAKYGTRVESMPSRFLFEMRGEAPPKGWRAHGADTQSRGRNDDAKPRSKRKKKASAASSRAMMTPHKDL